MNFDQQCPKCHGVLETDGTCSCGYGVKRRPRNVVPEVSLTCPYNDHGNICGDVGSLSDSTNGSGPWYCPRHFWKLKGWPDKSRAELAAAAAKHITVRDQWFKDHDHETEPPNLESSGFLHSIAADGPALLDRLRSGQLGPTRTRQPGEDLDEAA